MHINVCRGANSGGLGGVISYCFAPACVPAAGSPCSASNACGTNTGTVTCGGSCSVGPPLPCTPPAGSFTSATCTVATGTASDPDFAGPINVQIYSDGPAGGGGTLRGTVSANSPQPNWSWMIPPVLQDGSPHDLYAYAVNVDSGGAPSGPNLLLGGSPRTITCGTPTGTFNAPTCSVDGLGNISIGVSGTAQDPESTVGVPVRITSGPTVLGGGTADQITKNYAFSVGASEPPILDGNPRMYTLQAYAQDIPSGTYYQIGANQDVTCNPSYPTVSILSVDEPDYCQSGPDATVNWEYSSPGLPQGAWQLQIATDAGFGSIIYDSGKVLAGEPRAGFFALLKDLWGRLLAALGLAEEAFAAPVTTQHSASVGPGILQFASAYFARVRVWDDADQPSLGWSSAQPFAITATGPYPQAQFSFDPANPAAGQDIQFTDLSLNSPTSWLWGFGDGGSSVDQNPVYAYAASGSYSVTLQATNANGFCEISKPVGLQEALPQFREVRP